jgi:hypothetical protein
MDKKINRSFLRAIAIVLTIGVGACSPKVTTTNTDKSGKQLTFNDPVLTLGLKQSVPAKCRFIGNLRIGDSGFSTDCGYEVVTKIAEYEARGMGGNILKLTEIKPPNMGSTCYRIKADVYYAENVDQIEKEINERYDSVARTVFGDNPNFAMVHIFRPKAFTGSAISYTLHVGDKITCNMTNNSQFTVKLYIEGKTELWAQTEVRASETIDVRFGEEYYVRCEVKTGFWVGQPGISILEKFPGRSEISNVTD